MVAEASSLGEHLNALQGVLPEGGVSLIGEQLERVLEQQKSTLGLASVGALLFALWSANAGTKSIIDALNLVTPKPKNVALSSSMRSHLPLLLGF
jgi:membrane protein